MGSVLVSVTLFLASVLSFTSAQEDVSIHTFCWYEGGNFTSNTSYSANLNRLISSLSTLTPNSHGFYNISVGQSTDEDKVNAIAWCRGDVKPDDCVGCIANAGEQLVARCPLLIEADIWLEKCMFRYTSRTILGKMEPVPYFNTSSEVSVTDKESFNQALGELLDSLGTRVLAGGTQELKFAAGVRQEVPGNHTVYALVQCTPDLSESDCRICITQIFAGVPTCCDGKTGGSWMNPSCYFRFEVFPFFDLTFLSEQQPSSPPDNARRTGQGKGKDPSKTVISVVVPVVAILILIISCLYIYLRMRKKILNRKYETADEIVSADSLHFDFNTIRVATDDFSFANKIGEGGFGAVYKGLLPNGKEIAAKRLSVHSGQGDTEFKNEVLLMAKLEHRNLVRLSGFCIKGEERLLVYEFIPNLSLDRFLFDPIKRGQLIWEKRYDIIIGIARGLLYLHEGAQIPIIHRDLKASNILLDEQMQPKISDFGMARQFNFDRTQETRRIVGTYGYMAPEYAMRGRFSVKTDVYSFGVLVLEIITGQKNNGFGRGENADLPSFAWTSWIGGTSLMDLADPSLQSNSDKQAVRCLEIALLCVQENPAKRPTMASVVSMLSRESLPLPTPSEPAYFKHSPRDFPLSVNDVSVTDLSAR